MNSKSLSSQLKQTWQTVKHFRVVLFLLLLVVLYGFIGLRINALTNAQPDQATVASKAPAASKPHIDKDAVEKVKQLEDNNVNVQALFDQARQNPFRE